MQQYNNSSCQEGITPLLFYSPCVKWYISAPFYYLRITSFDEPHLIEEIAQYMIGEYKKEG